jgi:hypothetical protein
MRRRAGLGPLMAAMSPSDRHRHRMSPPDPLPPIVNGSRTPTSRRVTAKGLFIVFVEHHTASGQLRAYLFGLFAPS